ncbi:MAG: amidohydrolase family protein [Herbiconiux sp.]|nr:amidohydrolase family protein [Herbiconiux sp.]
MNGVLHDGRLPGGDGGLVDVTIVDGVVAGIHPSGSAPTTSGSPDAPGTVDLDGRWVIPGLWDNHVHFSQWAAVSRRLDVSAGTSAAHTAALVAAAVAVPVAAADAGGVRGEMLVGYGFRDGLWADEPSARLLDEAAGERPVVLVSGDLHCCWLNTAALAQVGLAGHPSGVLREEEAFAVHRALDDVPDETLDAWALEAARAAAARGVVGIVDLEMAWNHGTWSRRLAAGHDLLRVEFGVYPQHLERAIAEGLSTGLPVGADEAGALVHVGPLKAITDGSLNTRTAYCFDPYPGLEGHDDAYGLLTLPPSELLPLLSRGVAAGFTPAVHAIGDHANRLALDVFEALGCGGSLEHAQLVSESDLARFAANGVVASVQPEHAMDDRDVADRFWHGRTGRSFALASLLAAGARLALGSDAPVAPLDPWVTMSAAVGRTRDGRAPWHPEQCIPAEAALAASTRPRGLDHRIRVGDVADLVVTGLNPLASAPDELRTMPVALTLLAGRPTHSAL